MRPDEPERASETVQRLDHPGDERGVAAIARNDLLVRGRGCRGAEKGRYANHETAPMFPHKCDKP
jgi:hypothetical protein